MRVEIALPILAGAAAVSAQGLNFPAIFAAKPALKSIEPTPTTTVDRQATASSIISVLKEKHSKTKVASSVPTTVKTSAKKTTKKASATKKAGKPKATKQAKKNSKRQTTNGSCGAQPIFYGYTPSPNTPNGFLVDTSLGNTAVQVAPPAGYTKQFSGQFGSMFANNYLTYYQMPSYSPANCSSLCEATAGCQSFNIYFERDPLLDPNSKNCPNPTASTMVRCALWGSQITAAQAKNVGEWRADFMVVISGSNGYTKNTAPVAISGFTGPSALAGLVNINQLNGKNVFVGSNFYAGAYDVLKCSAYCTTLTATNKAAALAAGNSTYQACNYVDSAILSVNGVNQGTYCSAYSDTGVADYANQYSQTLNGVTYDIIYSYGYSLSVTDNGLTGLAAVTTTSKTTTTTTTSKAAATTTGSSCAALGSSNYTSASGVTYGIKCGYDLSGVGDLPNNGLQVKSFTDCFSACEAFTGCSGFVYQQGAGFCYFKSLSTVTTAPTVSSGNDMAFLPSVYNGVTAVKSSSTTTSTSSTSTTSKSVSAATPTGASCSALGGQAYTDLNGINYQTKCGYDLLNVGDIANAAVKSYSDCFTLCDTTKGCDGFAFVPSSNYCYMKNLTNVVTVPNANSGVDLAWLPAKFTDRSASAATTTTTRTTTTTTTSAARTSSVAPTSSPFYVQLTGNTGNAYNNLYLARGVASSGGSVYYYLYVTSSKLTASTFNIDNTNGDLLLGSDNNYNGFITTLSTTTPKSALFFYTASTSGISAPNFTWDTTGNKLTSVSDAGASYVAMTCSGSSDTAGILYLAASTTTSCVSWTLTTST